MELLERIASDTVETLTTRTRRRLEVARLFALWIAEDTAPKGDNKGAG